MSIRVGILFNKDEGLAHGEAQDVLAAAAVEESAKAIAKVCQHYDWEPLLLPVPASPQEMFKLLAELNVDVIFNLVEAYGGIAKFEAAIAWIFELLKIPYTGSPPQALSLALHKPLVRSLLIGSGIPVPRGQVLKKDNESFLPLEFPWIIKPSREDASHGIEVESVVETEKDARLRVQYILDTYRQPALVEEFIDGREFNVSILGEGEKVHVLPLGEIDFADFPSGKPRLVTYKAKWMEDHPECLGTKPISPRALDSSLLNKINEMALTTYRLMGLRDYGRIDFRLHPQKGPFVLDINTNPDISPDAGLARAAARSGLSYDELIGAIIKEAVSRRTRPS